MDHTASRSEAARRHPPAQPISQTLASAQAVSSIPELLETLGRLERLGIGGLYRLFVDTDPGNPERYVVVFEQAALSLPDESYYREERFAGVRDAFAGHVQRMFELAGLPDADRAARRVFALETAVAGHHWDSVASRDREKTYNLFTWTGVLSEGPDLRGWLATLDPPAGAFDEIVLRQPSFSAGLASLLTGEHVLAWRDWLCWRVIHSAAGYLSEAFVQEDLAIDSHSPGEFRCNQIVRNLDEFYGAFDVGATDKLWLDPATRIRIW